MNSLSDTTPRQYTQDAINISFGAFTDVIIQHLALGCDAYFEIQKEWRIYLRNVFLKTKFISYIQIILPYLLEFTTIKIDVLYLPRFIRALFTTQPTVEMFTNASHELMVIVTIDKDIKEKNNQKGKYVYLANFENMMKSEVYGNVIWQ